ncbi:MAG: hypothetical protein WCK98_07000 [bacterium]
MLYLDQCPEGYEASSRAQVFNFIFTFGGLDRAETMLFLKALKDNDGLTDTFGMQLNEIQLSNKDRKEFIQKFAKLYVSKDEADEATQTSLNESKKESDTRNFIESQFK